MRFSTTRSQPIPTPIAVPELSCEHSNHQPDQAPNKNRNQEVEEPGRQLGCRIGLPGFRVGALQRYDTGRRSTEVRA